MDADVEVQAALCAKLLGNGKTAEQIIKEAVNAFSRSILGGAHPMPKRIGRPLKPNRAAKAAAQSPGSLEARVMQLVKQLEPAKPGDLASGLGVDIATSRKVIGKLIQAGKLKAEGVTASRRISLA